jgi:hypothetical protein
MKRKNLTPLAIREMQIKSMMRHLSTSIRTTNFRAVMIPRTDEDEPLAHCWWECKMVQTVQNCLAVSYKTQQTGEGWSG